MFAKSQGATTLGVDGVIIDVEVDAANGLPAFEIVGLPDASVKEAKERVRTAIKNSGLKLRPGRVTVNLAPANLRKDNPGLDLPIALGLLAAYAVIPQETLDNRLFAAELSLEGELRGVNGILPMAVKAREAGFKEIFTSKHNANEALLVEGLTVYAVDSLRELADFLLGKNELTPVQARSEAVEEQTLFADDFADVQGQFLAKRALEIAAAGGHNVLMSGSPGSGKTMLARRINSILPDLTPQEALEVTKIYSIAGLLPSGGGLMRKRPFRSPHHTTSTTALIGGGTYPRPGEVTLAQHGVLFLDELPEFGKATLEVLRQPLEDRKVTISRVNATLTFPADFILVAAMNPCPCGNRFSEDNGHVCTCTPMEIKRYTRKISGPLLDRIDIHIRVSQVAYKDLSSRQKAENSSSIRERVTAARNRQMERLRPFGIFTNSQMNHAMLKEQCPLDNAAQSLLEMAFQKMNLSARSYDRIIKVARTIADLDGAANIDAKHIAEAVQLRNDIGLEQG